MKIPGRRLEGVRERDQTGPECGVPRALSCLPPGHPWPQLFLGNKAPFPAPAWAAALLLRSQTLHAISRLSAFALAVPSAKCLPHCPCLSTTSSFFKAQLGCQTSSVWPPQSPQLSPLLLWPRSPRPAPVSPSAFVAESTLGFASGRTGMEPILPCTLPTLGLAELGTL